MLTQHLEYILEVAKQGSMTKASKSLFVSQPTLTKAIGSIEKEYGIKIFIRTPKGVQLTKEGKEFIYYAKNILISINALDKIFINKEVLEKTVLSVASQQFDFLGDLIVSVYNKDKNKNIHYNIEEVNRSQVIQSVLKGDVNIGILVSSSSDSKLFNRMLYNQNLESHIIDSSKVYVSMGEKSAYYNKKSINFKDLEDQAHIILDMEDDVGQVLYKDQDYNLVDTEKVIFSNSINICIKFMLNTNINLYTPRWVLGFFEGLKIKSLPTLPIKDEEIPKNNLIWIKRKNEDLNKIELKFIDSLNKLFSY